MNRATATTCSVELRGDWRCNEPLAPYTTWRVGGPADRFYRPADRADLAVFLRTLPLDEPLLWLGLGSNLLVRDGGFRGTVILLHGALTGIQMLGGQRLRVEAGVPSAKLARLSAREGLSGIEFLAGIPGTLGGALAMNAGAWGGETWEWVETVETVDRHGVLRQRPASDFTVGYRQVVGPADEWFVAAQLKLDSGVAETSLARIRQWLEQRGRTQPMGTANCGSVFRNPPGDHAARLIESAGLKGVRQGGACISTKHANFIINEGTATAAELEALIEQAAATVYARYGIHLHPEVRRVGTAVVPLPADSRILG